MGLEDTIFTWECWDEGVNFGDIQFSNCVFIRDIGHFKKGEMVDAINISISDSKMSVYRGDEETCFSLTLVATPLV